MKTKTSLSWIIFCLILISSCGSTKRTQSQAPIPDQTAKSTNPSNMTETEKYINSYKYLAIKEMQRAKIPASITLAQGILESSVGQSYLARKANNHFGIKCNSKWTGSTINYDDDTANECFRSYNSVEQSYIDHSDHLANNPRYVNLFNLDIADYKGWATGLKAAGYATRSNYAELLIGIIDRYQLYEYDKFQSNKPKSNEKSAQFVYNGLPAVMVREGDTYDDIVREYKITMEKLVKYNDLEPNQPLHQDMILYLKAKKSKGKESYHIVKEGETMHAISQDYAIKLDNLYEMNLMVAFENPAEGEIIYLKQKRSDPPTLQQKVVATDEVKKDQPQETIFSDNQKKNIDQNNDFLMSKKDTNQAVNTNIQNDPEPQKSNDSSLQTNKTSITENNAKTNETSTINNSTQITPASSSTTVPITPATTQANPIVKPITSASSSTDYHIVQKGETMFSISKQYGMKVVDLQNLNGMSDNAIKIGQKLLVNKNLASNIPQQQSIIKSTVKPQVSNTNEIVSITPVDTSKKLKDTIYHIVQQGETFYSISREYKVKISDIIAWNNIKEYKLDIDKKIIVGAPEPKVSPIGSSPSSTGTLIVPIPKNNLPASSTQKYLLGQSTEYQLVYDKYIIVQPKQTLFSISKAFNITVDNLKEWNSLPDNSISIGQKLRVKP